MKPCFLLLSMLFVSAAAGAETYACAHRGDNKAAPENTLPAIKSAVAKGAHMIEFDVQMTKDGELVIMHDGDVRRTTNGEGKIADLTFAEIRKLDAGAWFDVKFAGTQVPTPREVLEVIPHAILCNVHLKKGPGLGTKTAELIKEMGRLDHCVLACDAVQADEAKTVSPEAKICNMERQGRDRKAYVDTTIERKADFIQMLTAQGADGLAEDIKRLHDHGVKVNWFSAQDETLIKTLAADGIDYILTDNLDLCLKVLGELGVKPVEVKP